VRHIFPCKDNRLGTRRHPTTRLARTDPRIHAFVSDARQTVARGLCWLYLQRNNSHRSTSSGHPAPPIGAFPNVHELRTLWQVSCCSLGNGRAADAPRIIACALPASKWFYDHPLRFITSSRLGERIWLARARYEKGCSVRQC